MKQACVQRKSRQAVITAKQRFSNSEPVIIQLQCICSLCLLSTPRLSGFGMSYIDGEEGNEEEKELKKEFVFIGT